MCSRETLVAVTERAGRAAALAEEMLATVADRLPPEERQRLENRVQDARLRHEAVARALESDPFTTNH